MKISTVNFMYYKDCIFSSYRKETHFVKDSYCRNLDIGKLVLFRYIKIVLSLEILIVSKVLFNKTSLQFEVSFNIKTNLL